MSTVYSTIANRYSYNRQEDGSNRITEKHLTEKCFSSRDVWHAFRVNVAGALDMAISGMDCPPDSEERGRFFNSATVNLQDAYKILTEEARIEGGVNIPEYGFTVGVKMLRYWKDNGQLSMMKRVYDDMNEAVIKKPFSKSVSVMQACIEDDIYNIIHGFDRFNTTTVHASIDSTYNKAREYVKKQQERREKVEKAAAEKAKREEERARKKAEREAERAEKAARAAAEKAAA